jgi:RNA polymerase sigma factor (sigma-70 family)
MTTQVQSSLVLLERARSGDADALDALLLRYLPRMRRWATGRLPRSARTMLDTNDVVQETLVKAVRNLDRIEVRDEGALQAYLRRALANRLADEYRRTARTPLKAELDSGVPSLDFSPLEAAIGRDTADRYERALQSLRDKDRQAVILRVELCYDFQAIAAALGSPTPGAARLTVTRALARLAKAMKG